MVKRLKRSRKFAPLLASLLLPLAMAGVSQAKEGSRVLLPLLPEQWQEVKLSDSLKPNQYRFLSTAGSQVVEIDSAGSMSLLARPISIDLETTPVLCWRWRINRVLETADMTQRQGDDYAARLYLSFEIPADQQSFGLRLQLGLARTIWGSNVPDGAINYVWDNRQPVDTRMPNAYTDRVTMIVAQTGDQNVGQWVWQRRNVKKDMNDHFPASSKLVQIALAADTDNTGESVRAEFSGLQFVNERSACPS
jgi:hypothetical protein